MEEEEDGRTTQKHPATAVAGTEARTNTSIFKVLLILIYHFIQELSCDPNGF